MAFVNPLIGVPLRTGMLQALAERAAAERASALENTARLFAGAGQTLSQGATSRAQLATEAALKREEIMARQTGQIGQGMTDMLRTMYGEKQAGSRLAQEIAARAAEGQASRETETTIARETADARRAEAETERTFRSGEAETGRTFSAGEAATERDWRHGESEADWRARQGMAEGGQTFSAGEAEKERIWRQQEAEKDRAARKPTVASAADLAYDHQATGVEAQFRKAGTVKEQAEILKAHLRELPGILRSVNDPMIRQGIAAQAQGMILSLPPDVRAQLGGGLEFDAAGNVTRARDYTAEAVQAARERQLAADMAASSQARRAARPAPVYIPGNVGMGLMGLPGPRDTPNPAMMTNWLDKLFGRAPGGAPTPTSMPAVLPFGTLGPTSMPAIVPQRRYLGRGLYGLE